MKHLDFMKCFNITYPYVQLPPNPLLSNVCAIKSIFYLKKSCFHF